MSDDNCLGGQRDRVTRRFTCKCTLHSLVHVFEIIDALALSDKSHTMVLVDILGSLVNDKNLDLYREGLADGNAPGYADSADIDTQVLSP